MSIVIKAGDMIKDNDPRCPGRILEVLEVRSLPGHKSLVKAARPPEYRRPVIIQASRIHTDGKVRKTGFNLVIEKA